MASSWLPTVALLSAVTPNVDWTGVRNGGASTAAQSRLPVKWSAARGIAWRKEFRDYKQSTPATWRDDAGFLHIQHRGPSYELCLDQPTGKTWWKAERKSTMSWARPWGGS